MVCIRMIQIQRTREHYTKLDEGGFRLWWSYCQVVLVLQDPDLTNSSPSQEAAEGLFAFAKRGRLERLIDHGHLLMRD